jgi:puromycin-sensitive aminopeptidase
MELVWQFYQNNFERIKKMLANASPSLMDACIVYSCGGFAHESKAQEVEQFFKEHPLPRNTRKVSELDLLCCCCCTTSSSCAVCDVFVQ